LDQVTTATIVNTWKSIGHKVVDDNDGDDEDINVANQPGRGQEITGDDEDEEAEYFIHYQVEEEREAPAPLLQHNSDNGVLSWVCFCSFADFSHSERTSNDPVSQRRICVGPEGNHYVF
jgi:hypothetical protein